MAGVGTAVGMPVSFDVGWNLGNFPPWLGGGYDPDALAYFTAFETAGGSFDQTAVDGYDSDFSAGVDGWTAFNGTGAGNIDSIGGLDNNYRYTVDTSANAHTFIKNFLTIGATYDISLDVFIPSTNTDLVGFRYSDNNSIIGRSDPTQDAWVTVTFTHTFATTFLKIGVENAANSQNFTGNGTDVIYIRNVRIRNTANATYTESYLKTSIDNFVVGCKTDGVWEKMTEAYLMAGGTFAGLTTKLKGTGTLTNNNFVTGDYLGVGTGAGLTDGASRYLDTGFDMTSAFNITDGASFGIYLQDNDSTVNGRLMGRYSGGNNETRIVCNSASGINAYPPSGGTASSGIGQFTHRFKNGAQELFKNGASVGSGTTSGLTMPSGNMWLLGVNGLTGDTGNTQSFAFIGEYLTDTEASNLSLRVNKLMYDLGCNTYYDAGTLGGLDSEVATYVSNVFDAGGDFE